MVLFIFGLILGAFIGAYGASPSFRKKVKAFVDKQRQGSKKKGKK